MKMQIGFLGLLSFVLVLSCNNMVNQEKQTEGEKTFEILHVDTTKIDTVFYEIGTFLVLNYIGKSNYIARWGSDTSTFSTDTIQKLSNGNAQVTVSKNKAIYIKQGCGSTCFFAYVLPFKQNSIAKYYLYPLAIDFKNNLIAYNGEDTESLAVVENYLTGQSEKIKADFLSGPFPGYAIDSIVLSKERVFIQWKNSSNRKQTKEFKLSN
jgi:hypothetical protein